MKSSPIIGFFKGVIGHLFLVDFITDLRLRKMSFFLIECGWQKILILESGNLVTCGEGVRHPTMPVQGQSFVLIKP